MENQLNSTVAIDELNNTLNGTVGYSLGTFINPFNKIHIKVTFCFLYSVIFMCCVFGNSLVLYIIVKNARMRTRTNFFLANLAVADFCVGVFCIFPNLSTYFSPVWHLGKVMCKLYYFVHYMSLTVPVLLLTVISVERYIAVLYPLKAKQMFTFRRLKILQGFIWLFLIIYNSPQLVDYDTFVIGNNTYCYIRSDSINTNAYVLANLVIWYTIPLSVLTFMYVKIAAVLWQSSSSKNFVLNTSSQTYRKCVSGKSVSSNQKENQNYYSHSCREMNDRKYEDQNKEFVCSGYKDISLDRDKCKVTLSNREPYIESECMSECEGETDCGSNTEIYSIDSLNSAGSSMKGHSSNRNSLQRVTLVKETLRHNNISSQICPEQHHQKNYPRVTTQKAIQARRKVIILLVMIIGSFAVLALPYHIRSCLYMWADTRSLGSLFSPICYLLYYANSGLNPLLYALVSDNFRKSFKDTFICRSNRRRKK
ncbi:trissin receptor [Octopus bimaculoides]|uniref:G-protein coupled receptors family 1 profile domain-containing protein n=1 Tax=Octopus bimaculoides TaxID=37653 RepID=A0A0L8HZH0_OCTBM|nr:trissin receptor [Octopus bimaculoides]XP_052826687.1 trissin receptor [Octopus bimaculoides]|eukprot:XP_014768031.1 PREDICTED: galanin receptor type 1-like [Octopus bimaculoides]